jgi:hypothetical protein
MVIGYLLGCLDTTGYEPLFRRAMIHAVAHAMLCRYRLGWRTVRTGIGFLRAVLARHPSPDLAVYPAHLHINLAAPYRGQGIGRRVCPVFTPVPAIKTRWRCTCIASWDSACCTVTAHLIRARSAASRSMF